MEKKTVISYTELKTPQSLLESAFRLLNLEPLSVLKGDLVEKEFYKSYHLFARDVYGIFGTATLTERPMKSLDAPLKEALTLKGQKNYYELSLLYATPPNNLEHKPTNDNDSMENLTMRYCRFFYQELFNFLCSNLRDSHIILTTTKAESEKIFCFGAWSFIYSLSNNDSFQGILHLPVKKHLITETPEKKPTKTARDILSPPYSKPLKEKNKVFATKGHATQTKKMLKIPLKPYKN